MFFVATAPLDKSGHVNVSPKGLDTLRVIDPQTLAYLDYVGSGAETIAHLRENGRIVITLRNVDRFEPAPQAVDIALLKLTKRLLFSVVKKIRLRR